MNTEAVCIHMLGNMLIRHTTWTELAFCYYFMLDNKDNISQWYYDLCNGDLP